MENVIDNKSNINNTIDKSEDYFENKITYISAGALGLSFAFIEKIVNIEIAVNKWLLIFGWVLLCITLLINLLSHLISKRYAYKIQDELDELDEENEAMIIGFNRSVRNRNFKTDLLNLFSGIILISGILFIIIFASLNITKQSVYIEKPIINKSKISTDRIESSMKLNEINLQINDTNLKIEIYGKKNNKNNQ